MVDLDTELFTDKATGTLTAEEVLGADGLDHIGVDALQLDLNGVVGIGTVVVEAVDGPWALNAGSGLLDLVNEDALDLTLVDQGGEGIAGVNEAGAARPATGAVNTSAVTVGVPEGNVIDLGRLVGHDRALQAQVAQDLV